MAKVICFNCEKGLVGVGKPLEELIKDKLPLFCSIKCSLEFPDNHTPEFEERLEKIKQKYT